MKTEAYITRIKVSIKNNNRGTKSPLEISQIKFINQYQLANQ